MSLWDDPQNAQEDLYFDDPHTEYIDAPVRDTRVYHHMEMEDRLVKVASEGFVLIRPLFLILTLVWFFFIVFPRELFMMCFDIAFDRDEQNRLPYYGSNHKGSPW